MMDSGAIQPTPGPHPTRRDRLEHLGFRAAVRLFATLPRRTALRAGAAIGELAYRLDARDRAVALFNLAIAFPDKSAAAHRAILRATCRNLGRVAAEVCHMSRLTPATLSNYVDFADRPAWERFIADVSAHGGLILTGHFGNWELLAYAHGLLGHPVTLVYRPMRNLLVDASIVALRGGSGTRALPKRAAAKDIIRTLRNKGIVVIAMDQNQSADLGVFVDFFGKPACTTFGLARLALLTGAPVYPAFLVREGESEKHRFELPDPVPWIGSGDREADLVTNTQRYSLILEDMIRRYPEQWIWFHKRWRTRPPGEAQFY